MSLTFITMVGLTGLVDSKRKVLALSEYRSTPNETTLRELKEARKAELRSIVPVEIVLGLVLGTFSFVYVRLQQRNA